MNRSDNTDECTIMITGSTSGIGKETAVRLAKQGFHIIVHGRDLWKTEKVATEIKTLTKNHRIDHIVADFSRMSEVRKFSDKILQNFQNLKVLINNAGFISRERILTSDENESQWTVNYLAPFLLTNLLLERLKENAPSRIINVSAKAHEWGDIDFDDIQREHEYSGLKMYCQCKLALNMFTFELSERLEGSGVDVNCLHPGVIRTGFDVGAMSRFFTIFRPFFQKPVKGARTPVFLATSPDVQGVTGKYFANKKIKKPSRMSLDMEAKKKLWEISLQQTGLR